MIKGFEYIFFDLDGTLGDPEHGLVASFEYGLGKMGVTWEDRSELKRFIGPPLYTEWQEVYGFTPEQSSLALDYFAEYYQVYGWWDDKMYGGVPEMLERLKSAGKKIILATSKPEVYARKILDLFGISGYFDFIAGAIADKIRDKKWEVLDYAYTSVGSPEKEKCIMVGDRKYDAEGAKICGISALGVSYGHGTVEELSRADFVRIAASPAEVADILV
jgi:phosphoglycolate phosphatase